MRAVQRIFEIIECFTPERRSLSLQEIGDRIGLPKATVFRIVHSLETEGYLVRLDDQQYCLSLRFVRIAGMVKPSLDIRSLARPVMQGLTEESDETVCMYSLAGERRLCIDTMANEQLARCMARPGDHAPLHAGSSSKAFMAHMGPAKLEPLIPPLANATKRSRAAILAELNTVKKLGYAVSHGERHIGLSGIAAPITDADEQVRYCLTLSGPTARILSHEKALTALLVRAAARISRQYGGKSTFN